MSSIDVLIVAGEVSGDIHASSVVTEAKQLQPELSFIGTGGQQMREAGVELLAEVDKLAVMGFSDVLRMLPRLSRLKKSLLELVKTRNIRLVILVDYPGFNLNLARALKKLDHPPRIIYYISPQVWAWRESRIRLIKQVIDQMAVVFPFEVEIYRKRGVHVEFVGHPLLDELQNYIANKTIKSNTAPLLALLPGSRVQEIGRHLTVMMQTARRLKAKYDDLRIGIGCTPGIDVNLYKTIAGENSWITYYKDSRNLLTEATAAAICSGTATLEAAILGVPQTVVYLTSFLNYILARWFVKLDNIALVNVTAGRQIVQELIQHDFTPEKLADELELILFDSNRRSEIINDYLEVKNHLKPGGAARKVAEIALRML